MWDVFWLNFHEDFPGNWEKLVFVICFGRFFSPAGCVVLWSFFLPPTLLPWLVFVGGSDLGVLFGNFFWENWNAKTWLALRLLKAVRVWLAILMFLMGKYRSS